MSEDKNGKKIKREPKYLFVICDEAHFFTSDSMFNPETDRILFHITRIFRKTIRVYMSATPYECLQYIERHEDSAVKHGKYPKFGVYYSFKRDYSYLDIKYYKELEELYDLIEESDNENWLVFIDNIKKGEEVMKELEDIDSLRRKVYAVSAESKYDEAYQKMVDTESINIVAKKPKSKKNSNDDSGDKDPKVRVLIATSVIDNGVNFRNIHNVVISELSYVKCKQMVGRARVDLKKGERVTLYIKRFTENEVSKRINYLQKRQDMHHDFNTSSCGSQKWFAEKHFLSSKNDSIRPEHWLATEKEYKTKYYINDIAVSLVNTLVLEYESILEEMQNDTDNELPGQKYLEQQLSWFGKTYDRKNDITLTGRNEGRAELIDYWESHVTNETKMFKDKQCDFKKELTRLIIEVFGHQDKNKSRIYSKDKYNTTLSKYDVSYKIESGTEKIDGMKNTYWKVISHKWDSGGKTE